MENPWRASPTPRRGPEAAAVPGILFVAFRGFCDDTQFVKNFILIGEWGGEKQKPVVMRVTQELQAGKKEGSH